MQSSDHETAPTYCSHLRSKKFFSVEGQPQRAADFIDGSNHCWCFLTMQVVGPEGKLVHPRNCQSDRFCFQSPSVGSQGQAATGGV